MQGIPLQQWGVSDWSKTPPRAGTSKVGSTPVDTTAAKPLNTVGLSPGYTPNYKDLILGDPAYQSWRNSATLDVNQAASARKAALQALATQYGGLPQGFQDKYGDLTPDILGIASGNKFSDISRLQRNYDEGVLGVKRSLAARGGLQSGELGYGLGQADLARSSSEYDMGQQFGNTAQQIINNYVGTENAARRAEADALAQAEQNVYANPNNRPVAGTSASLISDWQSKYGVPVYQGEDGKLYTLDENGNPVAYTPAAPEAQPVYNERPNVPPANPSTGTIGTYGPPAPNWSGPPVPMRPNVPPANPITRTIGTYGPPAPAPKPVTGGGGMTLEQARNILRRMRL